MKLGFGWTTAVVALAAMVIAVVFLVASCSQTNYRACMDTVARMAESGKAVVAMRCGVQ